MGCQVPFAADSAEVLRWAEAGGAAAVAWHSLTNCAYLLKGGGQLFLERLLRLVEVAPVTTADARRVIHNPALLKQLIVNLLDKVDWLSLLVDVKGTIYEELLSRSAQESRAAPASTSPRAR